MKKGIENKWSLRSQSLANLVTFLGWRMPIVRTEEWAAHTLCEAKAHRDELNRRIEVYERLTDEEEKRVNG